EAVMRRLSLLGTLLLLVCGSILAAQSQDAKVAKDFVKRGSERLSRGDIEGAIAFYDRAIQLSPLMADAFHRRGTARHMKGDLNGAIEDYEKAIALDPRIAVNNR